VEGVDMPEMEGMNMLEEHERLPNQRLEEEGMKMTIHMMEVEGMNMVEKRPSKERPKVEGMDMVEERPTKEWSEIEGLDMVEDTTAKVVEREHEARGVDEALDRRWSGEASINSSGTGACKVGVSRRSQYVCKFRLQLFDIA
jgi:hypothetical protein